METNDPIPFFSLQSIEVPEQAGSLQPWERAVFSSRILKTSILIVTAAIVFAILSPGNPLVLLRTPRLPCSPHRRLRMATGQSMQ